MAIKINGGEILRGIWRLLQYFRPQILRERAVLVVALATVVVSLGFQVLEPWPLKYIYDSVFRARQPGRSTYLPLADALSLPAVILAAAISLVVIVALGSLAEYFSTVYLTLAASRILTRIRRRLFAHVANLSIAFHSRARTGDIVTRITSDIDRLREITVTAILPFATNILVLLAMLAVMFWMNWRLGLVALFAFPVSLSACCV